MFCFEVIPKSTGTNCDVEEAVDKGFGESFVTAEESAVQLDKELNVDIGYRVCVSSDGALHLKLIWIKW